MNKAETDYRKRIIRLLEATGWNVSNAAKRAKMSRASFYLRLNTFNIKIPKDVQRKRGKSLLALEIPAS